MLGDSNWELERDAFLASHPPRVVPRAVVQRVTGVHAPWTAFAGGALFLVLGLIFCVVFLPRNLVAEWRLKSGPAETVRGSIVEREKTGSKVNGSRVWKHEFVYRTPDGTKHRGQAYLTGKRWKAGAKVDVLYLKDNPAVAMVKGARMDEEPSFVVFVLIFPVAGLAALLFPLFSRRRTMKLLRDGIFAEVRVDRVEKTSMSFNSSVVHRITMTYAHDGSTIVRRTWKDAEVDTAFRHLESGAPLQVIHDPRKPRRLLMPAMWETTSAGMSPVQFFKESPEALAALQEPARAARWAEFLAQPKPRRIPRWLAKETSHGMGIWFLPLIGSVFFTVGAAGCWALFPVGLVKQWRLDSSPVVTAPGKVVETFNPGVSSDKVPVRGIRYTFRTPDGREIGGRAFVDGREREAGEPLEIRYLAKDPAVSVPLGARVDVAGSDAFFIVVFPVIGSLLVVIPLVVDYRRRRLLRRGDTGEVRVEGFGRTGVSVNRRPQYAIRLVREDGSRVVRKTLGIAETALAASKLQTAEPVTVLFDPVKPDRVILVDS